MEKYRKILVEELASKGNKKAINELERYYIFSKNVKDTPIETVKTIEQYLLELAENNDNNAMVSLGSMYYEGRGVQQSYKKAVKWYEKAAEKLDPKGLCYLGYCYYYGRDIDVDYEKAYACFSQSAFLNDPNGMFKLGDMYFFGLFVSEDKEAAYYWYNEADVFEETQYERASIAYRLGKCLLYGYGVEQNLLEALKKLQSAEEDFFELVEEGDTHSAITLKSVRKEIDTVRNKLYDLYDIE